MPEKSEDKTELRPIKPYARNGEVMPGCVVPDGIRRIALGVEYNGGPFRGFAKQSHDPETVQGHLEKALSRIACEDITLVCAGRTDSGVHATHQIVHFDTLSDRPMKAWVRGTRAHMPKEISVLWAQEVELGFHARFSATARTYRYLLSDASVRPALMCDQLSWSRQTLAIEKMRQAAQQLVGEHDFSSFRASQCQAKQPVRKIDYIHLARVGRVIVLEIKANAFLHHMVRNIVGVLIAVGNGSQSIDWVADVLAARDRSAADVTAEPYGLHLVSVDYPETFDLPEHCPGPICVPQPLGSFATDQ